MHKYKISAPASFNAGSRLHLTKKQATPRAHNLKDLGNGEYEVVQKVQFKAGESLGYAGDLPKSLATKVEEQSGEEGSKTGPTVEDLKNALKDLDIDIPKNAKKADLQKLLDEAEKAAAQKAEDEKAAAEKQEALIAKALELSGTDQDGFLALPENEQQEWLGKAEEALSA